MHLCLCIWAGVEQAAWRGRVPWCFSCPCVCAPLCALVCRWLAFKSSLVYWVACTLHICADVLPCPACANFAHRWLAFSASLVYWVDFTLWRVWCGAGVDCESHGSDTRRTIKK